MKPWETVSTRRRGQPLAVVMLVLAGWVGFRVAVIRLPPLPALPPLLRSGAPNSLAPAAGAFVQRTAAPPTLPLRGGAPTGRLAPLRPLPQRPVEWDADAARERLYSANQAMLWMAAMSSVTLPEGVAELIDRHRRSTDSFDLAGARPQVARPSRWSGDGWLLLRQGGDPVTLAGGAVPPVYGGSQAGAVIRYRLAPGSQYAPAAYLRATQALSGDKASEIAAGLAARPLAGIPVTAHAELRATRQPSSTHVRPAVFLTAGFDDLPLPLGIAARGYAQAGYVAGRSATAFADGSLVVERRVARRDNTELSAGAGAWGGAQKGARRLDLGPSASLKLSLGELPARVSLDYRLRLAGDAEPSEGAALTLSTGF